MSQFLRIIVTSLILLFFLNGCMLVRVHEDTERIANLSTLEGYVESSSPNQKPIQVIVVALDENKPIQQKIVRHVTMNSPGPFQFLVPEGLYRISAFEDANENLTFEFGEYIGWYGKPDALLVKQGQQYKDLKVQLLPPQKAQLQIPALKSLPPVDIITSNNHTFDKGVVIDLDDTKFSDENAALGFWEPLKFLEQVGAGLYFLEDYDPKKIPVLFVHGAFGNPSGWKKFVDNLDNSRFQPWIFYYPSGLRLEIISLALSNAISIMHIQHKFDHLCVVAHSMGGLVSRGFINHQIKENRGKFIQLFITLSTPWGGDPMATSGVANSPAVVPCWYDMVPGSDFLSNLYTTQLPEELYFYLLFSHRGGYNLLASGNSDGTVSLKSQLILPAQNAANLVRGFDEDHNTILLSDIVIKEVTGLIEKRFE